MKQRFTIILALAVMAVALPAAAWAQFSGIYQMAQAQSAISSSMFSYKGYIDVGYQAGVGHYRANKLEATTSHGITTGNLFMGVGVGIDVLKTDVSDGPTRWDEIDTSDNAYMVPLFFDFRYYSTGSIGFYADFKTGISLLTGDKYISIRDGIIDNDVCFYFNVGVGVRFPISQRAAFNIGLKYSLISQNFYDYDDYYYHSRYDGISLHAIGVSAALEW